MLLMVACRNRDRHRYRDREGLDKAESRQRKGELDRVAAMLSRMGGRGYSVKEGFGEHGYTEFDPDPDPDSDKK